MTTIRFAASALALAIGLVAMPGVAAAKYQLKTPPPNMLRQSGTSKPKPPRPAPLLREIRSTRATLPDPPPCLPTPAIASG